MIETDVIETIKEDKLSAAREIIRRLGRVIVAFSAGADSTLLLALCLQELGPAHVLAVTADSPALPAQELAEARALAAELGASHRVIRTEELANNDFARNAPDRCFHCKRELFERLHAIAREEGYAHIVYGATADDLGDYRPGMQAAEEAGAVAPLLLAGLTKADIRWLSRLFGLRTWDKPAMACLSSRIPYGTPITAEILQQVEKAEQVVRQVLGVRQVRVRHHGKLARIELEPAGLERLLRGEARGEISAQLKALGFTYVTCDLDGFRSGSLNEALGPAPGGGKGGQSGKE